MNTNINKLIVALVVLSIAAALIGVFCWLTDGFKSGEKIMEYLVIAGSKIQGWFTSNNAVEVALWAR